MNATTILLTAILAFQQLSYTQAAPQQPNIVVIMLDDVGSGSVDVHDMPNFQQLAADGSRLTNFYVCPTCAPTRTMFLSGRYSQRPENNVYQVNDILRGYWPQRMFNPPPQGIGGDDELLGSTVTIAEALKSVGYATCTIGKYHVGGDAGDNGPLSQGFDANYGGNTYGGPGIYHTTNQGVFGAQVGPELDQYAAHYDQAYVDANIKPYSDLPDEFIDDWVVGKKKMVTDAIADAAVDWISQQTGPYFVVVGHYAAHAPVNRKNTRKDLYEKHLPQWLSEIPTAHAALVEHGDQTVARIMEVVDLNNTYVIYTSDNGGHALYHGNNTPYRGEKGMVYEGGIRVPTVVAGPGIQPGVSNGNPMSIVSLFKTFAGMAGASEPSYGLDGVDLLPYWQDPNLVKDEPVYVYVPGYLKQDSRYQEPRAVIIEGAWKYIHNFEHQDDLAGHELYNLVLDPEETTNEIGSTSETAYDLQIKLRQHLEETGAPYPTLRNGPKSYTKTYDTGDEVRLFSDRE